jgi:uncharacterized Rmd1/YagE family protein
MEHSKEIDEIKKRIAIINEKTRLINEETRLICESIIPKNICFIEEFLHKEWLKTNYVKDKDV